MDKFRTDIVNLESLDRFDFSIPTYQRPYVWGDEQLKKLLDDFYQSFNSNSKSIYYVGTFLTKEESDTAELIDGQQRFTTLWLVSLVFSRLAPESIISRFLKKGENLRLGFEIRQEVSEYLNSLLDEEIRYKNVQNEELIAKQPYLKNIASALVFIDGYIQQAIPKERLNEFGNYIYQNVHLIKNATPVNTDLNRLFSTVNSAGVQLEQTDIIKANLLSLIDEKVMYGKIWETCENMSSFFERNARVSFPETHWEGVNLTGFVSFDQSVFKYKTDESDQIKSNKMFRIDDLSVDELKDYQFPSKLYENEEGRKSEDVYCRSIINFGQLLLHTYRIHLHREELDDFQGTFHVNRLIEVFSELNDRNDSDEIKRFFRLLWEVRYVFDKYVIKWVADLETKNESLEIMNFNRNQESYYTRSKYEKSSSLMLQSVLYFTGDYLRQYWLTTYLDYLLKNHADLSPTDEKHLNYLEGIDNAFSLINSQTDKELSWNLLNNEYQVEPDIDLKNYLNQNKGTSFKHYWFQKLEYILWKNWDIDKTSEFLKYRITSKNSVEHIYPQNPENKAQHPEINDQHLHSFGNLVLLSVSQNSEYSNKSVNVKRSMFLEKNDTYDTLKSFCIFSMIDESIGDFTWNSTQIDIHNNEMIDLLLNHYKNGQ